MSRIGREDQQADGDIRPHRLIGKILYLRVALAEESDLAEEFDEEAEYYAKQSAYWRNKYSSLISYYNICEDED